MKIGTLVTKNQWHRLNTLVILGVPMEDLMIGSSLAIREVKNAHNCLKFELRDYHVWGIPLFGIVGRIELV